MRQRGQEKIGASCLLESTFIGQGVPMSGNTKGQVLQPATQRLALTALLCCCPLSACWNAPSADHAETKSPVTTADLDRGDEQETGERLPINARADDEFPSAGLSLGDWPNYPAVDEAQQWQREQLNYKRWALCTAELACAGRRFQGDPAAHRERVLAIVALHRSTLADISSFSTQLNQEQPQLARRWAAPINEAIKACQ